MSENVQIELLRTVPAIVAALAAITCAIIQIIGQRKHRKHEATSDANANGIAEIRLTLNGGLDNRIDEAVKRHGGEKSGQG